MLFFFTHQEKGGLFSGLRKKTPKASGDEAAVEVSVCDLGHC